MLSLTKQQKNQILQLVEQAKVNPRQFSWGVQASKFVTIFRDSAYLAAQGYEPDQAQSLTVQNTDYCYWYYCSYIIIFKSKMDKNRIYIKGHCFSFN